MFNLYYDGIEMDMYFQVGEHVLNVEIDGPSHRQPVQQRTDQVRDAYLRGKGITVVRISADALGFDAGRICEAIIDAVRASSLDMR